jgi:hypothetical protein
MPQAATQYIAFHVEHIVARQHSPVAQDELASLALACDRCNAYKGPNLTSIDPLTQEIVRLFHPRTDSWDDHFRLESGIILGKTATGRATAQLLNMNAMRRIELRLLWLEEN